MIYCSFLPVRLDEQIRANPIVPVSLMAHSREYFSLQKVGLIHWFSLGFIFRWYKAKTSMLRRVCGVVILLIYATFIFMIAELCSCEMKSYSTTLLYGLSLVGTISVPSVHTVFS